MRDLDTRAQIIMKQIDSSATEYMGASIKLENIPEDEKKVKLKSIQDLFNKAKEYGDDKVQLAIQTYEMVDKHIRRLDSDLSRFEMEIHDKTVLSKSEESVGKSKLWMITNYIILIVLFLKRAVKKSRTPKLQRARKNVPCLKMSCVLVKIKVTLVQEKTARTRR